MEKKVWNKNIGKIILEQKCLEKKIFRKKFMKKLITSTLPYFCLASTTRQEKRERQALITAITS